MALTKQIVKKMTIATILDARQTRAFVSDVPAFKNYGCAKLKKFSYSLGNICISYEKLVVNEEDIAHQSNGAQYNNHLVGMVQIKSKHFGNFEYGSSDAREIVDIVERFDESSYQR